jgi:hypothetical protein
LIAFTFPFTSSPQQNADDSEPNPEEASASTVLEFHDPSDDSLQDEQWHASQDTAKADASPNASEKRKGKVAQRSRQ